MWITAGHDDQFERFDFSWPGGCIEVKATVREQRLHEFALEQLQAPITGQGFVASLLLQPMSGGVGIMDLAKSVEAEISDDPMLKQKLWENVTSALGSDFSNRLDRRFDPSYAERQLIVFAMNDIPAPKQPENPRITSIRFCADLSDIQSSFESTGSAVLRQLFS